MRYIQNSVIKVAIQASAGNVNHEKTVNKSIASPLLEQIKPLAVQRAIGLR